MYGTLEQLDDGRWQLQFTRRLPHPLGTVWRVITEPEHLAHWFPSTIEGDRTVGAPLKFTFPHEQAPPIDGEMLAYDPPSLLEFRWGTDILRLELSEADGDTVLSLMDTFDERGKAARDGAGWHVCLDGLEAHLNGDPNARDSMGAWKVAHEHYAEAFGPEAATIGPPDGLQ